MTCRSCGQPIERREWKGLVIWGHVKNPTFQHHYAKPRPVQVAPPTESELRAMAGDR
jgi:hypothetical protein